MAPAALDSAQVSRLPAPGDNVAIAVRQLDAGTLLILPSGPRALAHTVLEGHRFAITPITAGQPLLSWGLPFGIALTAIAPGDYVSNQSMLDAMAVRQLPGVHLPPTPNFADILDSFQLDEAAFQPGADPRAAALADGAVALPPRTFRGYRRPGARGVGTRNTIVILGTTSRTASFARQLTARLQVLARVYPALDGIVAIAHTEGDGPGQPNNAHEVLSAIAGFIVHPNVGAVLAVDYGVEPVNNARLRDFMRAEGYPLAAVPHHFLTLDHGIAAGLAEGERIVRGWLPEVAAQVRTDEPLSALRIALQCGGSDAFSGVSGNPLAGALVHEVIRHGGIGVLTETDEAFGAESYLLRNVRDLATARAFLGKIDGFRERLAWHGLTAESNPSGGNKLRGLYNITLKSLGAVHKKDPRTRLDHVIDYAQPLSAPGFYFMNGPGNDLEGIAGQVGAGCNLFLFVTGNGSITNFPFAPTLKVTTTSRRHQLLIHEMDINAGRYLEGETMENLVAENLDLLIATASGRRTKGEHAGHSQVSLWRNWRQTDTSQVAALRARTAPDGVPLKAAGDFALSAPEVISAGGRRSPSAVGRANSNIDSAAPIPETALGDRRPPQTPPPPLQLTPTPDGRFATERVALILPTSLCAAQIARLAAERLNARQLGRDQDITRFVALTHTEGCGFGGETMHQLLHRTYRGYLTHPNVVSALLLEHGCEKVPNDVMRRQLETAGIPLARFGWASVQLDGGIEKAIGRIGGWFTESFAALPPAPLLPATLGALQLALLTAAPVTPATAATLAALSGQIVAAGGSVLLAESDPLLANDAFRTALLGAASPHATLAYGQPITRAGLHLVATESDHWVENLTGLGGSGAHLALALVRDHARQGHPLLALLQAAEASQRGTIPADDIDLFLTGEPAADHAALVRFLAAVTRRELIPAANAQGLVDFQLTRGLLGVST